MKRTALSAAIVLFCVGAPYAAAASCDQTMDEKSYAQAGGTPIEQLEGYALNQMGGGNCVWRLEEGKDMSAVVEFTIDQDGRVIDPDRVSSTNWCWAGRVMNWVNKTWSKKARFSVPTLEGRPICVRRQINVTYTTGGG